MTGNALAARRPGVAPRRRATSSGDDLFKAPAQRSGGVLEREGITGVAVPDSTLRPQPGLREHAALGGDPPAAPGRGHDRRQRPAAACTAPGIVTTVALPADQELSQTTENTVTATTDLGFAVTVEDTGDSQEVQVKVTLTIQQIAVADRPDEDDRPDQPGRAEDRSMFRNLGQVQFATKTTVKVDVAPVPQEKNTDNNSAEYPVIFSLG